jgi:hypothetical protein
MDRYGTHKKAKSGEVIQVCTLDADPFTAKMSQAVWGQAKSVHLR